MTDRFLRRDTSFPSDGDTCAAWLYEPREPTFDGACVVMANGASLTRHDGLPAFAERFAAGGIAALVFDHRCLGDSGGVPRQSIRFGRQREDWRSAIAHARSLPGCDPGRIVLWASRCRAYTRLPGREDRARRARLDADADPGA
jgi:hypothetical protein